MYFPINVDTFVEMLTFYV